jgi:EAL domain-containing protein (putative c-di-GMP-specific phosphodiesterase class I)
MAEGKALAERVRLAVDGAEFKCQERVFATTVSVAVVPLPPDAEGHKVLLGLANKALSSAKAGGGNSVAVAGIDAALAKQRREDREWVTWVKQRINEGHAHLATQAIQPLRQGTRLKPLLDIQLRIADEHGVRVPATAFLPAVVRHNLTAKFDLWLLRRVIRLLGEQPALLRQYHGVCIEVARSSLTEADFAERVAEVLAEVPALAPRLCFAIDARCAINHPSDVHRFVGTLEKTGAEFMLTRCKAALGLSALSTLPIHYVRIHESLMRRAAENPLDFGYVRWINQVAHDLGRLSIAAGVDTPALQEIAREIGLDYREGLEIVAPAPGREGAAAA